MKFMQKPHPIYSQRLEERRREVAAGEQRHAALGYARLGTVLAALALVWAALATHGSSIIWATVPVAAFVVLIVVHERLLNGQELRRRAVRFFERGLARLDGNWAGTGSTGDAYLDAAHPYAQDLDLFGKGSLFELLCTARTHIGEGTLAGWLLHPADPETVRARQQAVDELRERVDLREDLAVLAEEARTGVDPVSLAAWGEQPSLLEPSARIAIWGFTLLGIASVIAIVVSSLALVPGSTAVLLRDFFLVALLANILFVHRVNKRVGPVVAAVEEAAHELKLISSILERIEREQFHCELLARLRASLDTEGEPPSQRIARLQRLMDYLDSRDNLFVRFAEYFILWTPHIAIKVADWKRHSGHSVRRWLAALGEMEALCSLASHAFEHPDDPFPEFSAESPWFEAKGLAH